LPAAAKKPLAPRVALLVVATLVCLAPGATRARSSTDETLGFVISAWDYGFPNADRHHCPDGTNPTEPQYYNIHMKPFREDMRTLGWDAATAKHFPPDACPDPTAQPDPGFKTFDADVPVDGLDLDGIASTKHDGRSCGHDDFRSPEGTTGIDNQLWRLVGCTIGFQPFYSLNREGRVGRKKQGGIFIAEEDYPVLVEISGVDDRKNDDDVLVRIYSSAERITLDANGDVLPYTSLATYDDETYRSPPIRGNIEDGVLTTDPVDLRLRFKQAMLDGERHYRDARLRARINADGRLEGILGFYWDTDNLYRIYNEHRIGTHHTGRLLALAWGYMCAGMYHAIDRMADGHPDPETGKCTAISAALRFQATPVFIITDPN
jgi:hypothetical protein